MRQIFLDIETTGLFKTDRIIEVGVVEMVNSAIEEVFHQYINPGIPIPAQATRIHGINDEMVKDKPSFGEIADSLVEQIKDTRLIIHNAPFDSYYINFELALLAQQEKKEYCSVQDLCAELVDSLAVARAKFPGQTNSLDALIARFNIEAAGRADKHGALVDAVLLAKVYQAMSFTQSTLNLETVTNEARLKELNVDISSLGPFKLTKPSREEEEAHRAMLAELGIEDAF